MTGELFGVETFATGQTAAKHLGINLTLVWLSYSFLSEPVPGGRRVDLQPFCDL